MTSFWGHRRQSVGVHGNGEARRAKLLGRRGVDVPLPTIRRLCVRCTPEQKAHPPPPSFGPCLLWPNGWVDEDATWYGSSPHPRPHCIREGASAARNGHRAPIFSTHVYCGYGRPSQLLLSSCFIFDFEFHCKLFVKK